MRLIDADEFIANLKDYTNKPMTAGLCATLVELAPTAYDPDKVIKELEERTDFLKDCTKYGNKNARQQEKSYSTMMMYEVADLVDDLIEIVKKGGATND